MPPSRTFKKEPLVAVANFEGTPRWIDGILVKRIGQRSWLIKTAWGRIRPHLNHTRRRSVLLILPAAWEIDGSDGPRASYRQEDIPTEGDTAAKGPGNVAAGTHRIHPLRTRRPPDGHGDYVWGWRELVYDAKGAGSERTNHEQSALAVRSWLPSNEHPAVHRLRSDLCNGKLRKKRKRIRAGTSERRAFVGIYSG